MNKTLLILFLTGQFLLLSANIFGQGFCGTTGGFAINPAEGCAPLKVAVKNQVPKAGSISYVYNFDRQQTTFPEKKDTSLDSFYVYQNPGTYTIFQFGSAEGTGFSLCKDVVVYETRAPKAEVVACQNGRVRLTLEIDSVAKAYDLIEINWGDGSPVTLWKSGEPLIIDHKFAGNKIQPIVIRGKYTAGTCDSDLNTRTLSNLLAPPALSDIRISSVGMTADGTVNLVYNGMEGVSTEVFIDKGDGQFVTTGKTSQVGGSQPYTIENLNSNQIYRFKLISKDFCDNPVESAIVSSVIVKQGTLTLDEIIPVSWENYPNTDNILQYQLIRDGKVIFTTSDQLSYLDSDVKCGTNYTYEVAIIIDNDVRSYSAPITITPKSSAPETITKASVSVEDDNLIISKVELSGEGLTSSYDLLIERSDSGNSDFQTISSPGNSNLVFEDKNVNTATNSYCYRYSYKNACNLSSPSFSEPVCSILLSSNVQEVTWSERSPFTSTVDSYDLVQMDAGGNITDEIPQQLNYNYTIDLDQGTAFSFRVKAHSGQSGLLSFSNILNLNRDAIILIPDAFTPNGDGINERFEAKSYFTSAFSMRIYSRWGEVVFESKNAVDGWDGNINGKPADGGYYIFKIDATDSFKNPVFKTGSFLLIR